MDRGGSVTMTYLIFISYLLSARGGWVPHDSRQSTVTRTRAGAANAPDVRRSGSQYLPQLLRCEGCWWSTVLLMISGARSARTFHVE